jgi:hypothetical protein
MLPSENHGQSYEVYASGAIAKALRQIQRQAVQEGRAEEVLSAIRRIEQRLRQDPFGFGEPLYRLPALRLQVRCSLVRPLAVDFAVSEDKPLVFLKSVQLLAKHDS